MFSTELINSSRYINLLSEVHRGVLKPPEPPLGYAPDAVLEDVNRRLNMWSWEHIKEHRSLCKRYVKYYAEKLQTSDVPAHIQAKIDLHMSPCDIGAVMEILENNLKEHTIQAVALNNKTENKKDINVGTELLVEDMIHQEYVMFELNAELQEFSIKIYDSKKDNVHEQSTGVAQIQVYGVSFDAVMKSTSAMNATLAVSKAYLDIMESNTSQFKRLLNQTTCNNDIQPMVKIEVIQSISKQRRVTALINRPEVSLNIPFILSLLGILKEFVNPLLHGNVQTIPRVNKRQAQTSSSSDFLMTVSISNPRVSLLLLRDNILADTLTIQTDINIVVRQLDHQQDACINFSGLNIRSASATDGIVSVYKGHSVLSPCDISISYISLEQTRKKLSLHLSVINLTMSPSTVRMLLGIKNQLVTKDKSEQVKITAPADLWLARAVDHSKWYMHPIDERSIFNVFSGETEGSTEVKELIAEVQQVSILLQHEHPTTGQLSTGFSILLGGYMSHALKFTAIERKGNLKAEINLTVNLSAYNSFSDAWEPVLEPIEYHPWTLQAERVVLFTSNPLIAQYASGSEQERAFLGVSLSLKAIGLSLVNDHKGLEVAYIGLPQSDPLWEQKMTQTYWKPVKVTMCMALEKMYQDTRTGVVAIPDTGLSVDFTDRDEPFLVDVSGDRKQLRRSYFNGFDASLTLSRKFVSVSLKISQVQIDNQIPFADNPTIFYCHPPPPSIASSVVPKPFMEGSLILRNSDGPGYEIQFVQVLIQEMGFILDLEFLLEIASLVGSAYTKTSDAKLLADDLKDIRTSLKESVNEEVATGD